MTKHQAAKKQRRAMMKQRAVDYKGGKCVRCGYSRSIHALEFHHTVRSTKDGTIMKRGGLSMDALWRRLRLELDKCVMLCANCHREVEDDLR